MINVYDIVIILSHFQMPWFEIHVKYIQINFATRSPGVLPSNIFFEFSLKYVSKIHIVISQPCLLKRSESLNI